jgi:hypothetical protein
MMPNWVSGTNLVLALAAFLLLWYVIGVQVNRRRARKLVRQVRDSLQALGGAATIRWIGRSAFRIEVDQAEPPFRHLSLSVLLEPRETFILWGVGRVFGRRDWLLLSATLSGAIKGAFDVYHPGRRGAADSAHEIQALGWAVEPLPGRRELLCAAPGSAGRDLAREAMSLVAGLDVWRVQVRQKAPQLTVSLPIPATETRVPLPIFGLLPQLAKNVTV